MSLSLLTAVGIALLIVSVVIIIFAFFVNRTPSSYNEANQEFPETSDEIELGELGSCNQLPWMEINNSSDPETTIRELEQALESKDLLENDAAYFMVRLAEIYHFDLGDSNSSSKVLNQVIERFPDSRYAVDAKALLDGMKISV